MEANPAFQTFFDGKAARLTVMNIFPEDAGVFKCEAQSDHGSASTSCSVKVTEK